MTPAEKGYFKKQRNGFSDSEEIAYLELFDTLAAMQVFEQRKLKKALTGLTKSPYSLRNFMQDQILKSLRASGRSVHHAANLRWMLDKIAILNARGLQHISIGLIEKGLASTRQHGMSAYKVLFLIEKRQQLLFYAESERKKQAEEVHSELLRTTTSLYNTELIKEIHLKAIQWRNVHLPLRNVEVRSLAQNNFELLLQIPDDSLLGQNEYNLKYAALSVLASLLEKQVEAIAFQQKTIELMEKLDIHKMNRVLAYAAAIYNIATLCLYCRQSKQVSHWIEKLRQIRTENETVAAYVEALRVYLELSAAGTDNSAYREELVITVRQYLMKQHPIPNVFYDTHFMMLKYLVLHGRWEAASEQVYQMEQMQSKHSQAAYPVHVDLLQVLINYKLGNNQLLPSLIRRTYRKLMQMEEQYKTEKRILNFFRHVINYYERTSVRQLLAELHADLLIIAEDPAEAQVMRVYFDYTGWLRTELDYLQ